MKCWDWKRKIDFEILSRNYLLRTFGNIINHITLIISKWVIYKWTNMDEKYIHKENTTPKLSITIEKWTIRKCSSPHGRMGIQSFFFFFASSSFSRRRFFFLIFKQHWVCFFLLLLTYRVFAYYTKPMSILNE